MTTNARELAELATAYAGGNGLSFRNRIINGDMQIDQRNAGAAVTINLVSNIYSLDRWLGAGQSSDGVFTIQRSTTAPAGFTNSLLATVTTADASIGSSQYYFVQQAIEGFNVADLGWGTANAQSVTLSFWVRSSLTGTFGGSLRNSAVNRSYPFSYSISAANTWEQKTVTIAGDTTGTWLTDNGIGINVAWSLGDGSSRLGTAGAWAGSNLTGVTGQTQLIGTLDATWQITGVQLEAGSVATPFERRPYGTELALCQRYYQQVKSQPATAYTTGAIVSVLNMFVEMRSAPTLGKTSGNFNFGDVISAGGASSSSPGIYGSDTQNREKLLTYQLGGFSGFTVRHTYFQETSASNPALFTLSSEL
jgi:hypothetical protein